MRESKRDTKKRQERNTENEAKEDHGKTKEILGTSLVHSDITYLGFCGLHLVLRQRVDS